MKIISKLIPGWIKQYWKDPAFRAFTIFPPIIGVLWDVIITAIDGKLFFGTSVLALISLVLLYGIGYLKRNSP